MRKKADVQDRFFSKIRIDATSKCWEWTGYRYHGYGILNIDNKPRKAHRVSYEIHIGVIKDRLLVCHTCDNRGCVNPLHLYVGTYLDNNRDIRERRGHHNSNKTECPRGHPYSSDNTVAVKGGRGCRTCMRDSSREYQTALRARRKENRIASGLMNQFGTMRPHQKLSAADVAEIRARTALGVNTRLAIAKSYGVSKSLVQHIHSRRVWKSV